MLNLLPHSSRRVNTALLQSLRWQLDLQRIPEGQHERLQCHLLPCLEREEQPDIRVALIETLGHWQGAPADGIAEALLKKAEGHIGNEEAATLPYRSGSPRLTGDIPCRPDQNALPGQA